MNIREIFRKRSAVETSSSKDTSTVKKASKYIDPVEVILANYSSEASEHYKKQVSDLAEERETLKMQLKTIRMPSGQITAHNERIQRINSHIIDLSNFNEALKLGYDPYVMSKNFYVGTINEGDCKKIGLVLRAPMPAKVVEKYNAAKKANIFDMLLVGSSDPSLFNYAPSLKSDPVLVGYVSKDGLRPDYASRLGDGRTLDSYWADHLSFVSIGRGVEVKNADGFLIANWDLGKEVQAALNKDHLSRNH